jgi:hypothetical protein
MNKSTMMIATAAAAILVAAAIVAADEGKIAKSSDGTCQVTAPSSWTIGALPSTAASPDKSQAITVSSPKMIDSFDELKKGAKTMYKDSKVTKDAPAEFEMEGKSMGGAPDVYRAVPAAAGKYCIAEITYKSGTVDDARKIVETLKPVAK